MKILVSLLLFTLSLAFVVPTPARESVCLHGDGVAMFLSHHHVGAVEEIDLETDLEMEIEVSELPQAAVYIADANQPIHLPELDLDSGVPLYIQVRTLLI